MPGTVQGLFMYTVLFILQPLSKIVIMPIFFFFFFFYLKEPFLRKQLSQSQTNQIKDC